MFYLYEQDRFTTYQKSIINRVIIRAMTVLSSYFSRMMNIPAKRNKNRFY